MTTGPFGPDGYWHDLLAFTWNLKTCEGWDAIAAMLTVMLAGTVSSRWRLEGDAHKADGLTEARIRFATDVAHGQAYCGCAARWRRRC